MTATTRPDLSRWRPVGGWAYAVTGTNLEDRMFNPPMTVELLSTTPGTPERAELMRRYRGDKMSKRCDLPVGTLVRVTPLPIREREPYVAKIVGYDIFGSKYELSRKYPWGNFSDGGYWAFPGEVEAIDEGER